MSIQYHHTSHRGYPTRFYVLAVVSFLAAVQNLAWVTFSPITKEAKAMYGLTDDELALLPAYSPICFVILTVPFVWFLQKFGLKIVGLSGAWLLAIGCSIRCFIPYLPEASKWIWVMHIGHILIGYVGIPIMILPPKVSAVWFKPEERTFATSVAVSTQGIGQALGFVVIPYLTRQYDIRTMLYVQAELSICVALLFTIYFPSHPPTAPSISAEEDRTSFLTSFKKLMTNPSYVLLVLSGGLAVGINSGFQSVMSVILNPSDGFNDYVVVHSVDEFFYSTSWLGFTIFIFGTFFGVLNGVFAYKFQKQFKLILIVFIGISAAFLIWFSISIYGWGSHNPINLFVSYAMCSILIFASMPIFYEATIEISYPVAEGTSSGLFTLSTNVACLLFAMIGIAGVFSDEYPERSNAMAWVTTGAAVISLLMLFFYVERHKRLAVDTREGITGEKVAGEENSKQSLYINTDEEESTSLLSTKKLSLPD